MTKKLLFGMMAATMMFATSCENELDLGTNAGETAQVTFSVGTPEIATRAFSDGQTATVLQYAVYDADGNELTNLTKSVATDNEAEIHGSTTVNLQLTTGNTYSVIFWAAAENAPYTVDFAEKTMTADYTNAVSNDEARDAFYKYHTFTVKGAQTETIELKRPFAQLNVGTSDYAASTSAGYTPAYSYVKVPVYNTLDLVEGKVSTVNGTATSEDAVATEFKLAAIPENETFPVDGYDYLSMNYLLVAADKEVVDVVFGYSENNTTVEKTRTVGSVPVQRNYRTNIYGQLFTSDVDVNVVIEPDYAEPAHEADALHKAALNGGEVTLTENVVLTAPLDVLGNLVINLNGKTITGAYSKSEGAIIKNNGTLKLVGGAVSSTGANGASAIANYGELVVEGTEIVGSSVRENDGWPSYPINNYGSMTLKNANIIGYQGAIACGDAGTTILENCTVNKEYLNTSSHVFYIYHADAHVVVNGGTYTHNGMDGSLAYVYRGSITVNDGEFSTTGGGYGMAPLTGGSVVIKGGSFTSNPLAWGGEISISGGVFAKEPNKAWIAAGYKAVEKDGKFYVVADDVDEIGEGWYAAGNTLTVLTGEGFYNVATTVLADASKNVTVELANDIDLAGIEWPAVKTDAAFVLDGKGFSIKNLTTSTVEDHGFYSTAMFTSTRKATTIKNVVVDNATVTGNGKDNSHGAVLVACNYSDLTFSGVTVKNSTVSNCDRSAVITTYLYFTDVKAEKCVVEGCTVNSIGTAGAILGMNNSHNFEMVNCTVKGTTISSSEGSNKAGILIGTWQKAGTLTEEGNVVENSKAINADVETNNNIGRTV